MSEENFLFLVFLHNLVLALIVVLNSFVHSFLLSAIALPYWIAGWLIIYKKRKFAQIKRER